MPNSGITWGIDPFSRMSDYYESDYDTYLTNILTKELSKEINKQIIDNIFGDELRQKEERRKLRELRNKKIRDIFGDDVDF